MERRHRTEPAAKGTCHGFSLVELAVVMGVATLLLTGAIFALGAQEQVSRVKEAERQLQDIQEALLGFAIANGRLPRPAVSAINGAERGACTSDAQCAGFLAWQALGIGMSDPYGKRFRYSVTPAYAGGATGSDPIALTLVANRTVQTRDGAGALVYLVGSATCTASNQCAPAVILSHGQRRHGSSSVDGTTLADGSASNTDEDSNAGNATAYVRRPFADDSLAPGGEFDDLVAWVPLATLGSRLAQGGKL